MTRFTAGGQRRKTHAYNTCKFGYFNSAYPFLDRIKMSGPWGGTPGPESTAGWLTAFPAGATASLNVVTGMDNTGGYFVPGAYTVYSTSSAVLSIAASAGISGISAPAAGSVTFTVSALPGSWNSLTVQVGLNNPSGSPIAVSDLKMCLTSEKATLDAAPGGTSIVGIFRQEFLDMYAGARAIRFLDWLGINNGISDYTRYYSQMNDDENRRSYGTYGLGGHDYGLDNYAVPVRICAKLCKAVGAAVYINMPISAGMRYFKMIMSGSTLQVVLDYDRTSTTTHNFVNNDKVMLCPAGGDTAPAGAAPLAGQTVYWIVNATSTTVQLSATQGGSAITFTAGADAFPDTTLSFCRIACASLTPITDMFQPIMQSIYNVYPTAEVYVGWANEVWNSYMSNQYTRGPGSCQANGGTPSGDRGASLAWMSLNAWKAAENVFPAAQVNIFVENQAAFFTNSLSNFWDYVDPGIYDSGKAIKTIFANRLTRSYYSTAPYVHCETTLGDGFNTAAQADTAWAANGNSANIPDSYWDDAYQRGIQTSSQWIYDSTTQARAKVANIRLIFYEWGEEMLWGGGHDQTHAVAVGTNLKNYLDGPRGAMMIEKFWEMSVRVPGVYFVCQLSGPGSGYGINASNIDIFAIANNTDNQRAAFYRQV